MKGSPRYPTLVLAGRRNGHDPVAAEQGVSHKAIARVGGQPMLLNVLHALSASPWCGPLYISIDDAHVLDTVRELRPFVAVSEVRRSGASICTSIQAMISEGGIEPPFLVVTADHALLTPEMINHFWTRASRAAMDEKSDFALALVSKRAFSNIYPSSRRTFIWARDDQYSSCNMYAFLTPRSLTLLDFWADMENKRKRPLRLAAKFGLFNLGRYLLRLYAVKETFRRAGAVVGVNATAIEMPYPEAAIDIDTVQDLYLVEEILARRAHA